jgi:molybdopterin synthase catalytic subunit
MKKLVELTKNPIDTAVLLEAISNPDAGGEVLFVGTTRGKTICSSEGTTQHTQFLVYEAFEPMALRQLNHLVDMAQQQWPIVGVAVVHRLGKVLPGEASIAIAVSTPHRAEAFEAARWLIDSIKRDVPIWKQENFLDSTSQWVHPGVGHEALLTAQSDIGSECTLPCNDSSKNVETRL